MVQNAAMKPLRRIVGCKPWVEGDPRLSDAAIRQQVSALSAPAVVDIARLRHAGRLALQAPPQYAAPIQSKGGEPWRRELRTSMQLLQAMVAPKLLLCVVCVVWCCVCVVCVVCVVWCVVVCGVCGVVRGVVVDDALTV